MSKYTITNITQQIDNNTGEAKIDSYGNKRYKLFVKDEQGQVYNFTKGYKNEPNKSGDVLEGTLEEKHGNDGSSYYIFKTENGFTNRSGGYTRSPEEQTSIMRQHAAMDALAYLTIKAQALDKKNITNITPSSVFQVADLFLDYYKNGVTSRSAIEVLNNPESFEEILDEYLPTQDN